MNVGQTEIPGRWEVGRVYFLRYAICGAKGYGFLLHGVLPMMAYTGRLRPKGVPFSGLIQVYEKVAFHQVRYIKGKRNLSFRSVKIPIRVDRCIFWH